MKITKELNVTNKAFLNDIVKSIQLIKNENN